MCRGGGRECGSCQEVTGSGGRWGQGGCTREVRKVAAGGPFAGEGCPVYSVPGRAAYAVTIESGQHRGFGKNGVAQQCRGYFPVVVQDVIGCDGNAVGVAAHVMTPFW